MKVLNFGSLNIDFVYSVNHIVAPGETIASTGLEIFSGGKGLNQSIALSRAGARVYHGGMVGTDGQMLLEVCHNNGVNSANVKISDTRTGNAIIQVDPNGENSIILFSGANKKMTKEFIDEVLSSFSKGDLLVLQNEINLIDYIIEAAYKKQMIIALNPSPYDEAIQNCNFNKINYLILNEIEGFQLTGQKEPEKILGNLIKNYPLSKIVLTLGKDGCMYKDANTSATHHAYKVNPVDATAAGDTFLGFFLATVTTKGATIPQALETASKAAAIAVSRKGASGSIPYLKEVNGYNFK